MVEILIIWFFVTWNYFYLGIKKRRLISHFKNYLKEFLLHIETFAKYIQEYKDFEDLQSSKNLRLREAAKGLHQLLDENEKFYYSIFILIDHPSPDFLRATLESALNLSAPRFEVLLGLKGKQSRKVEKVIEDLKKKYPLVLQEFLFENPQQHLTESFIINSLAEQAKGNYFFILHQGDGVRADLLYRYEQTLHFYAQSKFRDNIVLFCDEYEVDQQYSPLPRTRTNKPQHPQFPYIFTDVLKNTLLISKALWIKVGGLCAGGDEVHSYDLPLRLDVHGAVFEKVPVHLYASLQIYRIARENKAEASQKILPTFERYAQQKNLDWHWEKGYSKNSVRALPSLKKIPSVHVVILFKNQRNLTLSAVAHVKKQVGVDVKITTIDNNSTDLSIAQRLNKMDVEVIRVEEPFNYSRLNNIAVFQTKTGDACDYILFLNNDVDLEQNSLLEMCRWIDQPQIGLVGCRLNYPNGLLQHGGVIIESSRAAFIKSWHHVERTEKFKRLKETNFLRISSAVTAACCLIKRKTFIDVGGFEEKWFPVAFSDTALAVKVRAKGLLCLYTPFAYGIHHESISRKKINIEDYESLTWTHRKFVQNLWSDEKIHFSDLINTEF